jgi:hypothetical protein
MAIWVCAVLWAAGFPKGVRSWLKHPKNASDALRWLTWALAGAFAGAAWLAWAGAPTGELGGFRTEATGIALAVIVIEEISRARAYLERKQEVIEQMASLSNDFAVDAARVARSEGWLQGGSFQGTILFGAKLQRADLKMAEFQGAYLIAADLQYAKLSLAHFGNAALR